jgi:anti-anti-sigma factor
MITPGVGNGLAPLRAGEGGMTVTDSRLPAARTRLRVAAPSADAGATGNQRTLTLVGNLDAATDETVRDSAARCLHDQPDVFIVDMCELNFCDSAGVRALRWVLRRAALVGATVRVIPPGEHLCRMLRLLGANDLLAVMDPAGPVRSLGQFLPGRVAARHEPRPCARAEIMALRAAGRAQDRYAFEDGALHYSSEHWVPDGSQPRGI